MLSCLISVNHCDITNFNIITVDRENFTVKIISRWASVITGLDYWTGLLDSNFNALKKNPVFMLSDNIYLPVELHNTL